MHYFKIIVCYDGTDFHGWQIQPKNETITRCMQKTFEETFCHSISLLGASRTDAGVHALGQVARFHSNFKISAERLMDSWNNSLPKSIKIRSIKMVSPDFHPLKGVSQKTYCYHLFLKQPLPFISRYGWYFKSIHKINWNKLDKCLQLYIGEHDFASFCKVEYGKSTIRKIDSIKINKS